MGLNFFKWSRTAANNATADAQINWAEGQAPSSINDSARAMMASTAGFRDDIAGAIVTGGTSTAYTVTSYQVFDLLANMNGQVIAFTPHITNAATVTLAVDSVGAKPLRSAPSTELPAGTLIQGTPYLATFNNSDAAWYLQGFYGNPYNVPISSGFDYWGPTTPNSNFVFPVGQAISRTTYSSLFSGNPWSIGTTYGVGDGSTTFNLPDKTERVSVMKASVATRLTSTYFGGNSTVLGAVGGSESHTLTAAQIPSITSSGSALSVSATSTVSNIITGTATASTTGGGAFSIGTVTGVTNGAITSTGSTSAPAVTSNNTSGGAHNNTQPTIVCNYIMRVV